MGYLTSAGHQELEWVLDTDPEAHCTRDAWQVDELGQMQQGGQGCAVLGLPWGDRCSWFVQEHAGVNWTGLLEFLDCVPTCIIKVERNKEMALSGVSDTRQTSSTYPPIWQIL